LNQERHESKFKFSYFCHKKQAMALIHSFEKSGNWLFRHRGELPLVLFLLAVPVVYLTDIDWLKPEYRVMITSLAIGLSIAGFVIRAISIGSTPKGTSGRNTKSGQVAESLNTSGIYSVIETSPVSWKLPDVDWYSAVHL
jgi:hypothetical protein